MIRLEFIVENTADLLETPFYGAGALGRWESCATRDGTYVEGGTFALVSGTSVYVIPDAAGIPGETWYRERVSNASGSTFSAYSAPYLGGVSDGSLTVTQLRQFITSSLEDAALQILLEAAAQAIVKAVGPLADVREQFAQVPGDLLMLSVRAESVTSVLENARYLPLTLATDDYELSPSGRTLRRLWTGTHPIWNWWGRVVVTYRPADDTAERQRVQRELVMLDLSFQPGLDSQTIGTWSEKYTSGKPYADQRAEILASLSSSVLPI